MWTTFLILTCILLLSIIIVLYTCLRLRIKNTLKSFFGDNIDGIDNIEIDI